MPITVDTPTSGGPPAVKFGEVGSYVDVRIINVAEVQSKDYDTDELEFWPDGKPKMHPRITGLVIGASGATVGNDDEERPVEVDELVSIYAQGARFFAWRDAKKAHGAVSVGDVLRWKFDHTETPTNPKFKGNPRKVFVGQLRSPRPDETAQTARCEELYAAGQQRTELAPAAAAPAYDDAPF
jgi:hypothetical protein